MRRQPRDHHGYLHRLAAALPLVLAFAVHAHLAQSNIHAAAEAPVAAVELASPAAPVADGQQSQPAPAEAPSRHGAPCLESLLGTDYLTPTAPAIAPPRQWTDVVTPPQARPTPAAAPISHAWRGRAPPSA